MYLVKVLLIRLLISFLKNLIKNVPKKQVKLGHPFVNKLIYEYAYNTDPNKP